MLVGEHVLSLLFRLSCLDAKEGPKKEQAKRTLQGGLVVEDVKPGSGQEAKKGDRVKEFLSGEGRGAIVTKFVIVVFFITHFRFQCTMSGVYRRVTRSSIRLHRGQDSSSAWVPGR